MAKKKRTGATQRTTKPSTETTTLPPPAINSPAISPAMKNLENDQEVIEKCKEALNAIRGGKHRKAVRLMKALCHKYENSALVHRIHGTVSFKAATIVDDPVAKQRYLNETLQSAKNAVSLSPNSVEFAQFYATILLETANDSKDYDEVVVECERALSIEKPNDPEEENPLLQSQNSEEMKEVDDNAETRIAQVHQELRALIQRSNLATISSWMKNLGVPTGQDNFRLIPVRRLPEDPLESRYLQNSAGSARKPNEIKKAIKTEEERRKEIEVRVAAAKLVQQKSGLCPSGDENSKGNGSGNGTSRIYERRRHKNYRRNASVSEMKEQVRSFWNSLSYEMKKGFLSVKFSDLKKHVGDSRKHGGQACEILFDVLAFVEMNKRWEFWACCRCGEKFLDSDSHLQHVVQEHEENLLLMFPCAVPQSVGDKLAEMLVNCSWKPLDLAAVSMLENQLKPKGSDSFSRDRFCSDETWDFFLERNSFTGNSDVNGKECSGECKTYDVNEDLMVISDLPLSDDPERTKLLDRISFLFKVLVRHKYLAMSHLGKVMQLAIEELQSIVPGSQILRCGVDKITLCICLLGDTQLKKVLKFLQELSHSSGLGRYPDKDTPEEASRSPQVSDYDSRIMLIEDPLILLLDESLLACDGMKDDVVSRSPVVISEKDVQSDSDSLLSWVYADPPIGEQLATWARSREDKAQQGVDVINMIEKEFELLQQICDKKKEISAYGKALQGLEGLYLEEIKKRESGAEVPRCSYDSILRKRRDELVEGENEVTYVSKRLELDVISNILKEAENLNVSQFGYEETYEVTAQLHDMESSEDDQKSKSYLHPADTFVDVALQRQMEHVSVELSKLDVRIMRSVTTMRQLKLKLDPVSTFDCRSILVPLVKSFMRAHLEDLAEKDATEKSDAAREAFLAELDLDSKKGSGSGNENSKITQEKMKDKRRNKDSKRNKDLKNGIYNEQFDAAEQFPVATAYAGDRDDTDIMKSVSGYNVNGLDEDFQRMVELQAEERKLEQTLAYQRQMEKDAKQKLLAEQQNARHSLAPSDLEDVSVDNLDSMQENLNLDLGFSSIADNECATHIDGDGRSKILRQLQVEKDEEDRFQEDLKKAVSQSLAEDKTWEFWSSDLDPFSPSPACDTLQAHRELDSPNSLLIRKIMERVDDEDAVLVMGEFAKKIDVVGAGLQNEVGEYNCFLNVIIQSLWHLKQFREEFLKRSTTEHVHVGEPCVVCSLFDILSALSMATEDEKKEPVAPTSLRTALSKLRPKSTFFQQGQMNDASEVLGVIFDCLHQSTTGSSESWDCTNPLCIAHSLFGMDVSERMDCSFCGLVSRHLRYTSFFHNVNASALREKMKESGAERSFDELMNLVEMNHQLACDLENGGCGKFNHISHFLSNPPHVFTAGWKSTHESVDDIASTLAALSTEIDINVLYHGLDLTNSHRLVSMVCYYGQHYHCFAYSHDHEKWIMYDDQIVKVVGTWEEVLKMCGKGQLQPQVLFYEAVNK